MGHIKLSDFGLSTGFHKQHDSAYYQRLLGGRDDPSKRQSTQMQNTPGARNSVMVNAINLTMTTKNDIATWKANRRKLAYSTVGTPDYVRWRSEGKGGGADARRYRRRSSFSKAMARSATGGRLAQSCSSVWSATRRSARKTHTTCTARSSTGGIIYSSRTTCTCLARQRTWFGGGLLAALQEIRARGRGRELMGAGCCARQSGG